MRVLYTLALLLLSVALVHSAAVPLYVHVLEYSSGAFNCFGNPTKMSSHTLGSCYKAAYYTNAATMDSPPMQSYKYTYDLSSNFTTMYTYTDSSCSVGASTVFSYNATDTCFNNRLMLKHSNQTISPFPGSTYYQRNVIALSCATNSKSNAVVLQSPGVCTYNDFYVPQLGMISYDSGSSSSALISFISCTDNNQTLLTFQSCQSTDNIYSPMTVQPFILTLSENSTATYTSVSFSINTTYTNYFMMRGYYSLDGRVTYKEGCVMDVGISTCNISSYPVGSSLQLMFKPDGFSYLGTVAHTGTSIQTPRYPVILGMTLVPFYNQVTVKVYTDGGYGPASFKLWVNGATYSLPNVYFNITGLAQKTNYNFTVVFTSDGVDSPAYTNFTTTTTNLVITSFQPISIYQSVFAFNWTYTGGSLPIIQNVYLNNSLFGPCSGINNYNSCLVVGANLTTYYVTVDLLSEGSSHTTNRVFSLLQDPALQIISVQPQATSISIKYYVADTFIYTVKVNDAVYAPCNNTLQTTCNIMGLLTNTPYKLTVESYYQSITYYQSTISPLTSVNINVTSKAITTISISATPVGGDISSPYYYTFYLNNVSIVTCTNKTISSCSLSGLAGSTTYNIRVTVVNNGITVSNSTSITTADRTITYVKVDAKQVDANTCIVSYFSDNFLSSTNYSTFVNATELPQCKDTNNKTCTFQCAPNYNYTIVVFGMTTTREKVSGATSIYTYPPPTPVSTIDIVPSVYSAKVSWSASTLGAPGNTTYEVLVSMVGTSGNRTVCYTSQLTCDASSLISSTQYYAIVLVHNRDFTPVSTQSSNFNTTSPPPIPCTPVCVNNGTCNGGICNCIFGFDGPDCSIPLNDDGGNGGSSSSTTTSTTGGGGGGGGGSGGGASNPTNSTTVDPNQTQVGVSRNNVTVTLSLSKVVERGISDQVVQSLDLSALNWTLVASNSMNITHPINGALVAMVEYSYQNQPSTLTTSQIYINFTQFQPIENVTMGVDSFPMSFAGTSFNVKLGALKYAIQINQWAFQSKLNILEISSDVVIPEIECEGDLQPSSSSSPSLSFINGTELSSILVTDTNGNKVYSRLINRAILDDQPSRISYRVNKLPTGAQSVSLIPYFQQSMIIDPDMTVLVANSQQSQSSSRCVPASSSNTDKKWKVIVIAVVVSAVGAAIIVVSSVVLYRKNKTSIKLFKQSIKMKVQK